LKQNTSIFFYKFPSSALDDYVNSLLQQLLELQSLDQIALDSKKQIENIHVEIERIQKKASQLAENLTQKQQSMQQQEVQYHHNASQLQSLEATLAKQKIRQLSTKKMEEYQALENANADLKRKMEDLEDKILTDLDCLEAEKKAYMQWVATTQRDLKQLQLREKQLSSEKQSLQTTYAEQCTHISNFETHLRGPFYEAYTILRRCGKTFPIIVPIIKGNQCSGCHLSVSRDTVAKATQNAHPQCCENCGRLLFVEQEN
jgi:predicted  nucleic acid-binding Zn-ribbon protein